MVDSTSVTLRRYNNQDVTTFAGAANEDTHPTPSGFFTGAANFDARYGTFNDVVGNQHNTYVNHTSQSEMLLAALKPVERGGYYVSQCMKGTREDVFRNIDQWVDDVGVPNVLWLSGSPGAGKSTIASSLVSRLTRRRLLSSSFFFRRGDVTLSDPAALWRTVAYDLATRNPSFANSLIQVLKRGEVDPRRPDIASHFQYLIQEPLTDIYNQFPSHTFPIVVVDALDECDSDRSQAAQRRALLDTLTQWSSLPKAFKLIVTGRDDRVPESFRAICKYISLHTGDDVSADANGDIRRFFEERFSELGGSSYPEWPGKQILDELTTRAAGLFIWAETVMKFVEQGFPGERLKLVLSGELGENDNLTKLYQQILELSFQGIRGPELEVSRFIIAAIVLAKVPLYYDDFQDFVAQPKLSVKFVLDKLSSVVSSTEKRLRIGHLSFSEFLCDHKRCPEQFFIDQSKESHKLAMTCFRLMREGLKFNICNLKTSYCFNDQVKELAARIKTNIPSRLLYSCSYWASHLRDTITNGDGHGMLITEVKDFLHVRFLYWLEVMSLTKQVSAANVALLTAVSWIEMFDVNLSAFARDASRFILTFDIPISLSTPHIYLSALPFSPPQSLVARQYRSQFPHTLSVVSGLDEHWPPIINIFRGHTETVPSVGFSPDGKRVVSGSGDTTICIWDVETGQIVAGPFEGHTGYVCSVAFSPDGKQIASGSMDRTIRIWNAETGQTVAGPFQVHSYFNAVAFSPDGKRMVSMDKMNRIWDAETGRIVAGPFKSYTRWIDSVAFSPDGKRVVCSYHNTIRIWDAETGEIVAGPCESHKHSLYSVAFSPDGERVISGSHDKTIWDAETSPTIPSPFEGHTDRIHSVAFSPDDKRVVSGSDDQTVRIWDSETGLIVAGPFEGHTDYVRSVAFSPNGKRVVSGSYDKTVRIWDAETGLIVAGPFEGHTDYVRSVAFSPNGKRVVSGSYDKTVRIWDAEAGQIGASLSEGHADFVNSVAFSPDSKRVVSGSTDKTIRIWDAETGRIVAGPFEDVDYVYSVAFSPDGRWVASGSYDNAICMWDAETGQIVAGLFRGHTGCVKSVAFSPDGKRVVSGSYDNTIQIWDVETGQIVAGPFQGHTDFVYSVAFSPDGKRVVSASIDKTICIWDAETGWIVAGPFQSHTHYVYSVAFSPDGKRVVSGSDDKTIRIWDAETGEMVAGPFEGHTHSVYSVAFSPDGERVVSGSHDNTICTWDVEAGQIDAGPFEGHTDVVNSVAFSPDGKRVVSGSNDNTIHIWDAEIRQIVTGPFEGHTYHDNSIASSPEGKRVISGFHNMERIWDTETPSTSSRMWNHRNVVTSIGGWHVLKSRHIEQRHGWVTFVGNTDSSDSDENLCDWNLAFWVPPSYRGGLCGVETLVIFGKHTTRLDLSQLVQGTAWIHCYSPGPPTPSS